jgi:hypothetical protein
VLVLGPISPLAFGLIGQVGMLGCEPHQGCGGAGVAGQPREIGEGTRLAAMVVTPHARPRQNSYATAQAKSRWIGSNANQFQIEKSAIGASRPVPQARPTDLERYPAGNG